MHVKTSNGTNGLPVYDDGFSSIPISSRQCAVPTAHFAQRLQACKATHLQVIGVCPVAVPDPGDVAKGHVARLRQGPD